MGGLAHRIAAAAAIAVALMGPAPASARDVDLVVRHVSVADGADGVRRTTEFSERVTRRGEQVWIERMLPPDAHDEAGHATGGAKHRHLDVGVAARWITREPDGSARVRMVPPHDPVVVDVGRVDWPNVGFDGSWAAAWHLIDPAVLGRMKATAGPGGTVVYVDASAGRTARIVWDPAMKLPRSVETVAGPVTRRTTVTVLPALGPVPWSRTGAYGRKDLSDYLD